MLVYWTCQRRATRCKWPKTSLSMLSLVSCRMRISSGRSETQWRAPRPTGNRGRWGEVWGKETTNAVSMPAMPFSSSSASVGIASSTLSTMIASPAPPGKMATHLHPRDVDVVACQDRSDGPDDARLVTVVGDQHVAGQRAIERESVDLHDRGILAVPDHRNVVRKARSVIAADDFEREVG